MPQQDILVESLNGPRRRLRLAVVTETFPPEINGVSLTLSRMVDGLRALGHELEIIRPAQPSDEQLPLPPFDQLLTKGVAIPRYPGLRMGMPAKRRLVRHWAMQRPDVVHVATEGPLGWSAVNAALQLRLPVTSDFRTNFHTYAAHYGVGWLQRPITAYLRKFHNRCVFTTVPTDVLREELRAMGFLRLAVVPRGVDTRAFSPAHRDPSLRARWGVGPDDLVIAAVGRLAPEKNLPLLLQAWQSLRRVQPRTRLLLVGDGPQRRELEAACPDAIFAGSRRGDDLAAHYASADLFAFPSLSETFGNVVLEALACGLPCVSFDHAAAGQLMQHGRGGILVDPRRPEDFGIALQTLALDTPRRQALAIEARQVALAESWDGVIARFEGLLRQAHGAPQGDHVGNLAEDGRVSPLGSD
jgi:glycosyltransferase involved in cell wall biosynthesis